MVKLGIKIRKNHISECTLGSLYYLPSSPSVAQVTSWVEMTAGHSQVSSLCRARKFLCGGQGSSVPASPLPPPPLGRQCEWSLPFALSMACWEEDTRYKFTAGKANWKTSTVSITQFLPLGIEVPWGFYLYLGTWVGLRIRIVSGHTLHLLPLLGSKRQEKSGKVNV